jgi:hypothetical protein
VLLTFHYISIHDISMRFSLLNILMLLSLRRDNVDTCQDNGIMIAKLGRYFCYYLSITYLNTGIMSNSYVSNVLQYTHWKACYLYMPHVLRLKLLLVLVVLSVNYVLQFLDCY